MATIQPERRVSCERPCPLPERPGELIATNGLASMNSPAVQVAEEPVDLGIAAIRFEEWATDSKDLPWGRGFRQGFRERPAYRRSVPQTYVNTQGYERRYILAPAAPI